MESMTRKCNTSSSRSREKIGAMRRAMGGTRDETEEEKEEKRMNNEELG